MKKEYRLRVPKLSTEEFFISVVLGEKLIDCVCSYCKKHTDMGRKVNRNTVICPRCYGKEIRIRNRGYH